MSYSRDGSIEVVDKFSKWARNISGIMGGNPEGNIWFCGIEYGGSDQDLSFNNSMYDLERSEFPNWNDPFRTNHPEYTKWQFCRKQAKIAAYVKGENADWKKYYKEEFLMHDSDTFCMNLFPLSFRNTDLGNWTKLHFDRTGFPCKTLYIAWCIQNRFPVLKELVTKYNPNVLICTGTTFQTEFLLAFSDSPSDVFKQLERQPLEDKKAIQWTRINSGRTVLVITPFLGPGGLMRDQSLRKVAQFVKSNCKNS